MIWKPWKTGMKPDSVSVTGVIGVYRVIGKSADHLAEFDASPSSRDQALCGVPVKQLEAYGGAVHGVLCRRCHTFLKQLAWLSDWLVPPISPARQGRRSKK